MRKSKLEIVPTRILHNRVVVLTRLLRLKIYLTFLQYRLNHLYNNVFLQSFSFNFIFYRSCKNIRKTILLTTSYHVFKVCQICYHSTARSWRTLLWGVKNDAKEKEIRRRE